jgi:predicted NBD/HSP70 family sugar kinase
VADSNRLHSINTSRILRAIWLNPGVSRIKVAEMLDLDRSTVTKIMQVILDRGLVVTAGKNTEQSGVGRRQINLEVNEEIGVVLGMEIQDSRYNAVVTTISGKVVSAFSACAPTKKENLVDRIAGIVSTAKKHLAGTRHLLLGAGVGLPGIIDPYTGRIIRSHSFGLDGPFDLLAALETRCDVHVIIENDANSCCWGDLAFKRESRTRNFMTVLGEFREDASGFAGCRGLAIGIGLVIRERVLHGDQFTAGEFRSMKASKETGQFTIPCDVLSTVPDNVAVLRDVYQELAENLAFLVNCMDLTKVVFAGDLAAHPENLRESIEAAVARNWVYDIDRELGIEFSEHGDRSVAIGAAGFFVEKLFSVPDVADRFQELVGYDLYEHILGVHSSKGK